MKSKIIDIYASIGYSSRYSTFIGQLSGRVTSSREGTLSGWTGGPRSPVFFSTGGHATYTFFYPEEKHRSRNGENPGEERVKEKNRPITGCGDSPEREGTSVVNRCSAS
jgi:hypothetical protein